MNKIFAAAVTAALASAVLTTTACTAAPTPTAAPTTAAAPTAAGPCRPDVRTDELPVWARGGFSGDTSMPHTLGAAGSIVAVMFGYPLHQPPTTADGRTNKILWVSAPDGSGTPGSDPDLVITARLDGTGDPVRQTVAGGPGPSIVDLPKAGCWRLTLAWSGRTDTMDLEYQTVAGS
ncbi:hypothetical protein [Hamadaea tsunoensis]|uniref:hypothetical protein n=1 Tax=Hamadaea tsunoensis TaxID=53368 RepID=UPI00040B5480|nr:hypothetical protein [Hamadaea tsunoensis]